MLTTVAGSYDFYDYSKKFHIFLACVNKSCVFPSNSHLKGLLKENVNKGYNFSKKFNIC